MDVKFLPKVHIERAASALLDDYAAKYGALKEPPVPATEIVDCLLGLSLGFNDLRARLGRPDVLGAIWIEDREVLIDQSLDPCENPDREGRYHFTVAHEAGHWVLHRHQLIEARSAGLFGAATEPSVVCRDLPKSRKPPIEWQADAFASYLLMPDAMLKQWWPRIFSGSGGSGNSGGGGSGCSGGEPYVAEAELAELRARYGVSEGEHVTVDVARQMANIFKVSGQSMQIRLVDMGLILEKQPPPSLFG